MSDLVAKSKEASVDELIQIADRIGEINVVHGNVSQAPQNTPVYNVLTPIKVADEELIQIADEELIQIADEELIQIADEIGEIEVKRGNVPQVPQNTRVYTTLTPIKVLIPIGEEA